MERQAHGLVLHAVGGALQAPGHLRRRPQARELVGDEKQLLWRERPAVEKLLKQAVSTPRLAVINQLPSFAWSKGVGATLRPTIVDADQRLVPPARKGTARRVASYELQPSIGRALSVLLARWVGL